MACGLTSGQLLRRYSRECPLARYKRTVRTGTRVPRNVNSPWQMAGSTTRCLPTGRDFLFRGTLATARIMFAYSCLALMIAIMARGIQVHRVIQMTYTIRRQNVGQDSAPVPQPDRNRILSYSGFLRGNMARPR